MSIRGLGEIREKEAWPLGPEWRWLRESIWQTSHGWSDSFRIDENRVLGLLIDRCGVCRLPVGSTPLRDEMVSANRERLRSGLGRLRHEALGTELETEVELWCGTAECDGSFVSKAPLDFMPFDRDRPTFKTAIRAPLEVGATKARTTFSHIAVSRAVARWPYGSEFVTILATDPGRPAFMIDAFSQLGVGCVKP